MVKPVVRRGTKYRWLRRSLRVCVVLFLLLNIMAAFHAWRLTHNYPSAAAEPKKPEQMSFAEKAKAVFLGVSGIKTKITSYPSLPYEVVNLMTKDQLKIEAWLIKTDSARGTVILFHGHMANKGSMLSEAGVFRELGYNTMLVDFRAHGNSDGVACTIGKKEAEEVKLAYDYAKASGDKKIILWGTSMGAAAICCSIHDYPVVPSAVILEMPFGSLKNAVEGRVRIMGLPREPISSLLTFWGGVELGFWSFGYQPKEYVKKITCPVLLQWGELDKRVTRTETESIYRNIATPDKKLELYPGAGHGSLLKQDSLHWRNTVNSFLNGHQ